MSRGISDSLHTRKNKPPIHAHQHAFWVCRMVAKVRSGAMKKILMSHHGRELLSEAGSRKDHFRYIPVIASTSFYDRFQILPWRWHFLIKLSDSPDSRVQAAKALPVLEIKTLW